MADQKITDMTEATEAEKTDLFLIVKDPAGTPETQKITGDTVVNTLILPVIIALG